MKNGRGSPVIDQWEQLYNTKLYTQTQPQNKKREIYFTNDKQTQK